MATVENLTAMLSVPVFQRLEMPAGSDIPLWFTVTFASINGCGFCLNALSLWLLATKRFVYRAKVNFFVVSLCSSDLIVSVSSFYFLATITSQDISTYSKRVSTIIFSFALETSLMNLCTLSYERLIAIRKPFHYQEILSGKRVAVIIILSWIFSVCLLAMQFLFGFIYRYEKYIYFNWISFIVLSLVSITFLAFVYSYLIYEIHRHSSHIKSCIIPTKSKRNSCQLLNISNRCDRITSIMMPANDRWQDLQYPHSTWNSIDKTNKCKLLQAILMSSRSSYRVSNDKVNLSTRGQLMKKERRSVLFCLCIVIVFAASWLPVTTFFIRCLIAHSCERDDQLLLICSCMVSMNSLLDPILYFIIKREFREFVAAKICRKYSRRGSAESKRGSSTMYL